MFSNPDPLNFGDSLSVIVARNQLQTLKTTGSQARPSNTAPNPVASASSLTTPGHVQNVQVQVQKTSDISSKVVVTYQRNPQDYLFVDTRVFVSGYKGNPAPVQMASGISPVSFSLENTGEPVAVTVQASGNLGQAPISTAPTTTFQLTKTPLATTPTTAGNGTAGSATFETQGTPNLSQTLLNIEAIDTSAFVSNPSGGNVAIQGTQFGLSSPAWWGSYDGSVYAFGTATAGLFGTGTGNQVKCAMIRVPYLVKINKVAMLMNTTSAGAVAGYGVYTAAGSKIFSWDSINIATTGLKTTTLGATVILQPGLYFVATSCSNTSSAASQNGYTAGSSSEGIEPWSANGTIRSGTAANAMSAGVMPATLGTISLGGGLFSTLPYYIMEP